LSRPAELLDNPEFISDLQSALSGRQIADKWGIGKSQANEYRKRLNAKDGLSHTDKLKELSGTNEKQRVTWTGTEGELAVVIHEDMTHENILKKFGHDSEKVRIVGVLEETHWQTNQDAFNHRYRFKTQRRDPQTGEWPADSDDGPKWPVIQQAARVILPPRTSVTPLEVDARYKVALKCADTQIGFRALADGSLQPFHDDKAMAVFIAAVRLYQPSKVTILGDFLDLASQGRFAQEAAFARTTQLAINHGHAWLAELRQAAPNAEIILVEGNHDLRMQNFIEANALAAFGLKRANLPESWPVMSLPYLLRLDELDITYIDAYPAATDWDNDLTRNIHGTKANSKGSTMSQYVHDLPHVNTWAGHTHRAEIVYRSVLGARGEAVESYAANPGCLCRTDGAVPSVNGAIGANGTTARVVEDWQNGLGVLYYNETESIPAVYRIRNGECIIDGRILSAD
jgi:hypothetical protein